MTAQDTFEARVEALLFELSAPAAGPARSDAVDAAVAARGAATRRWWRWDGGSRQRLFAIASLAIGTAVVGALLGVGGPSRPTADAPSDVRSTPSPTRANVQPQPTLPSPTAMPSRVDPPLPNPLPGLVTFTGPESTIEIWEYESGAWRTLALYDRILALAPDFSWYAWRDAECDGCPVWVESLDESVAHRRAYATAPDSYTPQNQRIEVSPDGRGMVRSAPGALEIVDLDGGPSAWRDFGPLPMHVVDVPQRHQVNSRAWSPDSRSIAFTLADGDLYVLDVASGDIERITSIGSFLPGNGGAVGLDWSDDGTRIATTDADRTLYIVTVANGATRHFDVQLLGRGPSFSHDGTKLGHEFGYITIDDGIDHPYSDAFDTCDMGPIWSPSASRSATIADGALTLDIDGSQTVLARDVCVADSVKVTWSPDESWIAVATSRPFARPLDAPYATVTLYPIVGGDPVTLFTNDGERDVEVIWSH